MEDLSVVPGQNRNINYLNYLHVKAKLVKRWNKNFLRERMKIEYQLSQFLGCSQVSRHTVKIGERNGNLVILPKLTK